MKKLKLNHRIAQEVLRGERASTWRLYDDKHITVDDEVAILDKVDESRPASWRIIGTARITRVVEKRLADIGEGDYQASDRYDDQQLLLREFRGYYGDRVTLDTPVKVIDFDFTPGVPDDGQPSRPSAGARHRIILYADGGSRGNPGPSACGYVLLDEHKNVLVDKGVYLGITTNNQAEYQGLRRGLEEAAAMGVTEVDVRLDSLLVVNQMKGVFKVKNRDLWPVHAAVKKLLERFDHVSFSHVPRELNKLADAAANRAMDDVAADRRIVSASTDDDSRPPDDVSG